MSCQALLCCEQAVVWVRTFNSQYWFQVYEYTGFISEQGSFDATKMTKDHIVIITYWKSFEQHEQSHATKYHVTAANRERNLNPDDDRLPEFSTMSLKAPKGETLGGIGYQYIVKAGVWHRETLTTHVRNNGYIQRMPSYFFRNIFGNLPEDTKNELREESIRRTEEMEEKEIRRLRKLGFKRPEYELGRRRVAAAKEVLHKAQKKGLW